MCPQVAPFTTVRMLRLNVHVPLKLQSPTRHMQSPAVSVDERDEHLMLLEAARHSLEVEGPRRWPRPRLPGTMW